MVSRKSDDRESPVNRRYFSAFILILTLLGLALVLSPSSALASGSNCDDPTNRTSTCTTCINSTIYQNINSGNFIINAMFSTINNVLQNIEFSFFNGIVGSATFQVVIGTAMILYVAMYGVMIMFNLSSYRLGEVLNRLMKVAFVYMLTSPTAWVAFNQWIQNPVIGATNQLITEFNSIAEGGSATSTVVVPTGTLPVFGAGSHGLPATGLDATSFTNMFGPSLTAVFSMKLFAAILAMAKTGFFGWLISIFLIWALLEFSLMMLGAIITYAKAIIGLAFLFALAPLFIIFLLFEKTRDIFWAWTSHVLTFCLQPVLLFSFLSFYVALVNRTVPYLLTDPNGATTDYCWSNWFSMPGTLFQMYMWTPVANGIQRTGGWNDSAGNVIQEPIDVPNAMYFLMLCYLGKTFTNYIGELAENIGDGVGPGVTAGQGIENKISQLWNSTGGKKG